MGRRKSTEVIDTESTQTELTIENQAEMESEEAELLAEAEVGETSEEVKAEESESPAEEVKPKRRRRSRRKPQVEATEEKAEETTPVVVEMPNDSEVQAKLREELAVASVNLKDTLEMTLKQWSAIRDVTASITTNLEKLHGISKPNPEEFDTQEFFRPQQPKSLFITKFATAASIGAVVLSLVSLTLSQSARQAALVGDEVVAKIEAPFRSSNVSSTVPGAPEVAVRGQENTNSMKQWLKNNGRAASRKK